jgi:hypothetical protein
MNLETWIATASENLVPKAAEKVREDISMHVGTAINRYQLERRSELEALELAVKDLGNAKVAARGFEKTYLTVQELAKFSNEKDSAHIYTWYGIFFLFYTILLIFMYIFRNLIPSWKFSVNIVSWTILIFTTSSYLLILGYVARKKLLNSYILCRIIFCLLCIFTILIPSFLLKYSEINQQVYLSYLPSLVFWFCFVIWALANLRTDYFKWRKLRFL